MIEQMRSELRYAARQLMRSPLFTIVSMLSLGLAITVAVAAYSLVNGMLFKPLPVSDPRGVVHVFSIQGDRRTGSSAYADLADYVDTGLFASVAASAPLGHPVVTVNQRAPERVDLEYVSPNFFQTIRLAMKEGRAFTLAGDAAEVIISERYRDRAFKKGDRVLGATIMVDGLPFTVVGVAPHAYRGTLVYSGTAMWMPATQLSYMTNGRSRILGRDYHYWSIVGRLGPDITPAMATQRIAYLPAVLAQRDAQWKEGRHPLGIRIVSHETVIREVTAEYLGDVLLALGVLVAVILILACTNVAGLQLARAVSRRHEVAVRLTLGASRMQIATQFVTEALLLAALGGVAGFIGAQWLVVLAARSPMFDAFDLTPDWRVFATTAGTCVICAVIFGATPLAHTLRININGGLAGTGLIGERGNTRGRLIALQVCLSCMLVVLGMHASRGVQARTRANAAFHVDGLVVAELDGMHGTSATDSLTSLNYINDATEMLRTLPDVRNTAISNQLPLVGSDGVDARATPMNAPGQHVRIQTVDADYFATLGVGLTAGRIPDWVRTRSPGDERIAVVSTTMREKLGSSPVGRKIRIDNMYELRIVGEVPELKEVALSEKIGHVYEVTDRRGLNRYRTNLIIRVRPGSESAVMAGFTRAMRNRFPDRVPPAVTTLSGRIAEALAPQRYIAAAAAGFGLAELALAAVGLYSMLLYALLTRTREIGIRLALGAPPARASYAVLKSGLQFVAVGLVLGAVCAVPAGIIAGRNFMGSDARDPLPYIAALAGVVLATIAAAYVPARKATHVEPMSALRYE
jgi:predicted permease